MASFVEFYHQVQLLEPYINNYTFQTTASKIFETFRQTKNDAEAIAQLSKHLSSYNINVTPLLKSEKNPNPLPLNIQHTVPNSLEDINRITQLNHHADATERKDILEYAKSKLSSSNENGIVKKDGEKLLYDVLRLDGRYYKVLEYSIGKGQPGTNVLLTIDLESGKGCVVKKFDSKKLREAYLLNEDKDLTEEEIEQRIKQTLEDINHENEMLHNPNINQGLGIFIEKQENKQVVYLGKEYIVGKPLEKLKLDLMTSFEILTLAKDLIELIDNFHANNFIHRDLKRENIIYNPNKSQNESKTTIIDHATTVQLENTATNYQDSRPIFTRGYLSPQLKKQDEQQTNQYKYVKQDDKYSLYLILASFFELITQNNETGQWHPKKNPSSRFPKEFRINIQHLLASLMNSEQENPELHKQLKDAITQAHDACLKSTSLLQDIGVIEVQELCAIFDKLDRTQFEERFTKPLSLCKHVWLYDNPKNKKRFTPDNLFEISVKLAEAGISVAGVLQADSTAKNILDSIPAYINQLDNNQNINSIYYVTSNQFILNNKSELINKGLLVVNASKDKKLKAYREEMINSAPLTQIQFNVLIGSLLEEKYRLQKDIIKEQQKPVRSAGSKHRETELQKRITTITEKTKNFRDYYQQGTLTHQRLRKELTLLEKELLVQAATQWIKRFFSDFFRIKTGSAKEISAILPKIQDSLPILAKR